MPRGIPKSKMAGSLESVQAMIEKANESLEKLGAPTRMSVSWKDAEKADSDSEEALPLAG